VFPIRGKISNLGFRVAEKKNGKTRVFSGFEVNVNCARRTQYHFETTTVAQ